MIGFRKLLPVLLCLGWFTFAILRSAWVSDDAYITFRSVENLLHGYGPVFNIGERVQTFTHPLWMLLQAGTNAVPQQVGALNAWSQMFYVNIFLSLGLSVATALVFAFGIARSAKTAVLGLLILAFSMAFTDYSTSGLENPLTHLLLAVYLALYMKKERPGNTSVLMMAFVAGLAGVNRFDTLLLYLPALVFLIWQSPKTIKTFWLVLIGLSPFLLWEIFSLVYYGVPFPNTAYAKLNTGISTLAIIQQGAFYYLNSLRLDPLSLLTILGSCTLTLVNRQKKHYPIVIGIVLYLLYILYIGGDFMSGRYFTAPLLASVALLSLYEFPSRRVYTSVVIGVLVIGLLPVLLNPLRRPDYTQISDFRVFFDNNGISDERAVYFNRMGLLSTLRTKPFPGSNFAGRRWIFQPNKPVTVKVVGPLGVAGYQAGPNVHMIDTNALADPLMVRLLLEDPTHWRAIWTLNTLGKHIVGGG